MLSHRGSQIRRVGIQAVTQASLKEAPSLRKEFKGGGWFFTSLDTLECLVSQLGENVERIFLFKPLHRLCFYPACPRRVEFHVVFSLSVLESVRVSSSEIRVTGRLGKYAFCVSLRAILESNRCYKTPARATLGSVKVTPLKGLIPSARPQVNAVTTQPPGGWNESHSRPLDCGRKHL